MLGGGGGEELGELGDEGGSQGAAGDDDGEGNPQVGNHGVDLGGVQDEVGGEEGAADAHDGGDPHQPGQRLLEVHVVGIFIFCTCYGAINIIGKNRSKDAEDTHDEDPDEEFHLHRGVGDSQEDEGDEGHAGDAVGLEAVGGGSDGVAGIVAGAVGNDAGVARVVLADFEDHLHEVASDVGNLGEDTAGDAQGAGAQALTDGEADEAAAGQVLGHEEQDDEHQHQLDADEHNADGHTGAQRDVQQVEGFAAQRGEGHAGVGIGVHADAEPCHAVAAQDADDRPGQNQHHGAGAHLAQHAEIQRNGGTDENKEQQQELALLFEVRRTGLENDVSDFEHRLVSLEFTHLAELPETEQQSQHHHREAPIEDGGVGRRGETRRHFQVCLACK